MIRKFALFLVCILSLLWFALPAKTIEENVQLKALITRKYVLGPSDEISISVYDSPEFDNENIKIQPDGYMVVAPFGAIQVAGLSVDELYDELVQKYKFYLRDPKVTIKLEKMKPFIVYVTGAVLKPGSFELNTDTATAFSNSSKSSNIRLERKTPILSNILIAAGGISFDADLEHVQITNRMTQDNVEVNLLKLLEGDTSQDIYLMAYDTVHIPKLPTPFAVSEKKYKKYLSATFSPSKVPVKVYGYVNRPGLILLDSSTSLNLNSAIAAAGGYLTDSAYAPEKIYLSRADVSGKLVTTAMNPKSSDHVVMPNDIIYVPEKPRPMVGKAFDYLDRVILPLARLGTGFNSWALMFNPGRYYNSVGR